MDEDQLAALQDGIASTQAPVVSGATFTPQQTQDLMMLRKKQVESQLAAAARQQQLYEEARAAKQQQLAAELQARTQMSPDLTGLASAVDSIYGTKTADAAKVNAQQGKDEQARADALQGDLTNLKLLNPSAKMGGGSLDSLINGQARNAVAQGRLGLQQDNQATRAGQDFERDPTMLQIKATQRSLGNGLNQLNGEAAVTGTTLNQVGQDIIRAQQKGTATEGSISRELVDPYVGLVNTIRTKFGDIQDLRNVPEAQPFLKQLKTLANQIKAEFDKYQAAQTNAIAQTYSTSRNPRVHEVVKKKVDIYAPQSPAGGATSAGAHSAPEVDPIEAELQRRAAKKGS